MTEWSNVLDCKSSALVATEVRILPGAPMFSKSFYIVLVCIGALFVGFLFFLHLPEVQSYIQSLQNQQLEQEEDLENFLADQETDRTPCTATPAAGVFSDVVVPAGKKLYTNEEVGFRFIYPSSLSIKETIETEDWSVGTCVYSSRVRINGRGWELVLNATRGGFATGREGFNQTRTIPLSTQDGHEFSLLVDDVCEYSEHGDCGYSGSLEKDGISFLIYSSQLASLDGINQLPFKEIPEISEILSTLETVQNFDDPYGSLTLIGFENSPDVFKKLIEHISKYRDPIAPDSDLNTIELKKYRHVVWTTNCLTFATTFNEYCQKGTIPGYEVLLSVDGDIQIWQIAEDGVRIQGNGTVDLEEINW